VRAAGSSASKVVLHSKTNNEFSFISNTLYFVVSLDSVLSVTCSI
jgi:hypothetical protein